MLQLGPGQGIPAEEEGKKQGSLFVGGEDQAEQCHGKVEQRPCLAAKLPYHRDDEHAGDSRAQVLRGGNHGAQQHNDDHQGSQDAAKSHTKTWSVAHVWNHLPGGNAQEKGTYHSIAKLAEACKRQAAIGALSLCPSPQRVEPREKHQKIAVATLL